MIFESFLIVVLSKDCKSILESIQRRTVCSNDDVSFLFLISLFFPSFDSPSFFLFLFVAYASMLFGLRCRSAVLVDWCKVWLFGRDVSRE